MVLSEITLNNFRNFLKNHFEFAPQTTVVYGPNGSGKSNLLEAVYILATGGSLRARREVEMINADSDYATVGGILRKPRLNDVRLLPSPSRAPSDLTPIENKNFKIEVTLAKDLESTPGIERVRKRFKVSGIARRRRDFTGRLPAVLFNPEQINTVSGEPAYRRNYLDLVLSQTGQKYIKAINTYDKARIQRNRLLYQIKIGSASAGELNYWEGLMEEFGIIVSGERQQFINYLNEYLITNKKSFEKNGYFTIIYQSSIVNSERLREYRDREIQAERTLIGPHRDDFYFDYVFNGDRRQDLRYYGSRGRQRLAVFALKMAEWQFLKEIGTTPILLLDDIFSELDDAHREIILSKLDGQQAILTTAEENVVKSVLKGYPVIRLGKNGLS